MRERLVEKRPAPKDFIMTSNRAEEMLNGILCVCCFTAQAFVSTCVDLLLFSSCSFWPRLYSFRAEIFSEPGDED